MRAVLINVLWSDAAARGNSEPHGVGSFAALAAHTRERERAAREAATPPPTALCQLSAVGPVATARVSLAAPTRAGASRCLVLTPAGDASAGPVADGGGDDDSPDATGSDHRIAFAVARVARIRICRDDTTGRTVRFRLLAPPPPPLSVVAVAAATGAPAPPQPTVAPSDASLRFADPATASHVARALAAAVDAAAPSPTLGAAGEECDGAPPPVADAPTGPANQGIESSSRAAPQQVSAPVGHQVDYATTGGTGSGEAGLEARLHSLERKVQRQQNELVVLRRLLRRVLALPTSGRGGVDGGGDAVAAEGGASAASSTLSSPDRSAGDAAALLRDAVLSPAADAGNVVVILPGAAGDDDSVASATEAVLEGDVVVTPLRPASRASDRSERDRPSTAAHHGYDAGDDDSADRGEAQVTLSPTTVGGGAAFGPRPRTARGVGWAEDTHGGVPRPSGGRPRNAPATRHSDPFMAAGATDAGATGGGGRGGGIELDDSARGGDDGRRGRPRGGLPSNIGALDGTEPPELPTSNDVAGGGDSVGAGDALATRMYRDIHGSDSDDDDRDATL